MKRQAMRHPKTERLATVLNLPLYAVWGILEGLWQFAAEYAQTGSLSRFSNDDIARKLTWEKDPNDLINALIECNFLDSNTCCDEHRLLIHDWKDHLQDSVSKFLKRNKLDVSVKCPDMSGKSRDMFRLPRPRPRPRPDLDQTRPPSGGAIPDSVESFLPKAGIDDPLTDDPPSKLSQALIKLGKQPARIGGREWDRIKRAASDMGGVGGEDAYAARLEEAIAAGMTTYESAETWVRRQDWKKGESNGNGVARLKPPPGKYDKWDNPPAHAKDSH